MNVLDVKPDSPIEQKAVAYFWILLGKPTLKMSVLNTWLGQMTSLINTTGYSWEEFKDVLNWFVNLNSWTAENLRLAKDPMGSLVKQWDNEFRKYNARRAGDLARAQLKTQVKKVDPNALIITEVRDLGDKEKATVRSIQRRPRNDSERKQLQDMLFDVRGRENPNIVRWLAIPTCEKCKGVGYYTIVAHPEDKKRAWQKASVLCECVTENHSIPA